MPLQYELFKASWFLYPSCSSFHRHFRGMQKSLHEGGRQSPTLPRAKCSPPRFQPTLCAAGRKLERERGGRALLTSLGLGGVRQKHHAPGYRLSSLYPKTVRKEKATAEGNGYPPDSL
ncbi:unnamed protein product [Pleuronectes platessa]|uniref:Uncharacterized protein n=1 Tax=Pleuronectes platessa TaxID=8262 RepID=A0A9N7Z6C6_PLEPL|nr:unnamed protein product [Pleuronectes platessa]